jgi:hypothetical protein
MGNTTLYLTEEKSCESISSSIEALDPNSQLISMDKDYKFKLNLRTRGPVSSNIDIYLNEDDLKFYLLEPLETVLSSDKTNMVCSKVVNRINYHDRAYYKIYKFINDNILMEFFKIPYDLILETRFINKEKFLEMHSRLSYRILFFKHYPRMLQPKNIIIPINDAKDLYNDISML